MGGTTRVTMQLPARPPPHEQAAYGAVPGLGRDRPARVAYLGRQALAPQESAAKGTFGGGQGAEGFEPQGALKPWPLQKRTQDFVR